MRSYEAMYIVHPETVGEARTAVIDKYSKIVEDQGGQILKVDEWGERKLAYPIRKMTRGSYVLMFFEADPASIAELERRFRLDDNIIRFQTMLLEKGFEVVEEKAEAAAEEETAAEGEETGE
ncbi:MAG: 30S ribosomal protein S6 [Desulfuromonadales bacterium]|nr:30S ribosomal protein S6 [Desulfuromonadales bacterium]NIR34091.1 30S ribosomal protein S6 [Desulfuromonadales bacterium]NIS40190.1 30S ribosomal protein S6 [Desulfuromonadales bacterium]